MAETSHLTPLAIDRLLAGVGDPAAATAHADQCPECAEKLAAARRQREEFLQRNPPRLRAAQLVERQRAPARARRWSRWLLPIGTAVAIGIALLIVRPRPTSDGPDIIAKGGAAVSFTVFRPQTGRSWVGRSGEVVVPGDAVQLEVSVHEPTEVAVYSLGAQLERLWSQRIASPGPLGRSLVVDEAPHDEWLVVAVASEADRIAAWETEARRALAQAGPPAFAPPSVKGVSAHLIWLHKQPK